MTRRWDISLRTLLPAAHTERVLTRRETPADVPAARAVIAAAFGKPDAPDPVEATLLDALRTCGAWLPELSFVAVDRQHRPYRQEEQQKQQDQHARQNPRVRHGGHDQQGERDRRDEVVGYVVCTRGHIDGVPVLGLGPIGVRPDLQRRGVGLALVHSVLGAADALGEPLVALLGSPAYYRRFGFRTSSELGILPPDPAWGEYFQVRALTSYEPSLRGTFRYAEPFDRV